MGDPQTADLKEALSNMGGSYKKIPVDEEPSTSLSHLASDLGVTDDAEEAKAVHAFAPHIALDVIQEDEDVEDEEPAPQEDLVEEEEEVSEKKKAEDAALVQALLEPAKSSDDEEFIEEEGEDDDRFEDDVV